jgi:hypothetical protein
VKKIKPFFKSFGMSEPESAIINYPAPSLLVEGFRKSGNRLQIDAYCFLELEADNFKQCLTMGFKICEDRY